MNKIKLAIAIGCLCFSKNIWSTEAGVSGKTISHISVGVRQDGDALVVSLASQSASSCHLDIWNDGFYILLSDPKSKSIQASALTALSSGKTVMIYYNDAGTKVGMQGVGTTGCLLENLVIDN